MRSNMSGADPSKLWEFYVQLTEVEQAFKELKGDLSIRPIYHQNDERIEARIFAAFMAYCLQVTLKKRLRALAPGLTPRSAIETMAAIPARWRTADLCKTISRGLTNLKIANARIRAPF